MARYIDPKCRLCRREGAKLFLKGKRCLSPKCPIEKKGAVPPGMKGVKRARRPSEYGVQLREKQKAKRIYGVSERQFRAYVKKSQKTKNLIGLLERRLDNVVYRLGFAPTRPAARQLVSHRHVLVDTKPVNIPSYELQEDQTVALDSQAQNIPEIKKMFAQENTIPGWLERKAAVGRITRVPNKEDIIEPISEQEIIEFYSR